MKFIYVVETINTNGIAETSVHEVEKPEIRLGRGTSSDILLHGRLVSLDHAVLRESGDILSIEDQGSLSGVLVNGSLVKKQVLNPGDKIKIGEFTFEVTFENSVWGFLERRRIRAESEDLDKLIEKQHRKLQFQTYLPSTTVLSSALCLLVFVLFFIGPITGINRGAWNSGPISNAHKMIEDNCASCHAESFRRVRDAQCLACHEMSEHAATITTVFERHPDLNLRCATCHMEHNGSAGIIAEDSSLCADCHGQIAEVLQSPDIPSISSWRKHPEFRVTVAAVTGSDKYSTARRISLSDKQELRDTTAIKLNHQIHLQPDIAGAEGLTTLKCGDCHQFDRDYVDIKPISFEEHCASCHPLEFDERLPGRAVPHGSPDVVYNYLFAEYAKLFLATEGEGKDIEACFRARKPGKAVSRGEEVKFARSAVESTSRSMEESLFTRTACHLCHDIRKRSDSEVVSAVANGVGGSSAYEVVQPQIPTRWMPASTFDHGAHQEIACESCHVGVRDSEETADVLLPGIDNCKQCHAQENMTGMVVSECVTCHSYHQPLLLPEERKREIEKILYSFNWPSAIMPSQPVESAAE